MSSYVDKLKIAVRLSQPNLDPRDGHFLLFPTHGGETRPESLLELLNSDRTVLPFLLGSDQTVLLVTRINIDWVIVPTTTDPALVFPPDHMDVRTQPVELRFVDESRVQAEVCWTPRAHNERLSDLLNRGEAFFASETNFGTLIVNKYRVREMHVREAIPHRRSA